MKVNSVNNMIVSKRRIQDVIRLTSLRAWYVSVKLTLLGRKNEETKCYAKEEHAIISAYKTS